MGITQEVSNLDLDLRQFLMMYHLKTINHRKLVQELYDKRTLHNLLGLKPSPITVNGDDGKMNGNASRRPSPPRPVKIAQSTRHETPVESDEDYLPTRRRQDQNEGRYDIGRRPRKFRKIERPQDSHTVFTTDDDDEYYERSSVRIESADSFDEEEAHYAVDKVDLRNPARGRAEKRRSYWLSKAINIGGSIDDD
jgi:hypothetical protein